MNNVQKNIPNLEERFTEPEGWRWHFFTREGRKIRFGSVSPKNSIPDAVVVCLPGLSEFGEKYYETARTCNDLNLAFWVIDWMGQGESGRYISNSQKRHATSFQDDVDDLHYFYTEYIKHSCVHPDVGRIPVAMLAHSMGANIGLHYLNQHPDVFECAGFSAPMFGLKALEKMTLPIAYCAGALLQTFAGKAYVSGEGNWNPETMRPSSGADALSNDLQRASLHKAWFEAKPELQVGGITYRWLHQAIKSFKSLHKKPLLNTIETPCLIALAGQETLVDNTKSQSVCAALKSCKLKEFPEARHEILMEKDDIRDQFFKDFFALIKENIIDRPETLKPF